MSIESAYATSYLSLILSLDVSLTVLEIFTFKARKWLVFPPCLVWRPRSGDPLEFLDETYPAKTRRIGLSYDENFIILTSFWLIHRMTDRRMGDSIQRAKHMLCCRAVTRSQAVARIAYHTASVTAPLGVTWRHRSRDHVISHMAFSIGAIWWSFGTKPLYLYYLEMYNLMSIKLATLA